MLNCEVTIDYGLGGDSNIVLDDCKIDKFKFAPKYGGTVTVFFRIVAHPETRASGLLCDLIGRDIKVMIKLPPPANVQELFNEAA
mgnify:CR=1 FL=1